MMPVFPQVRTDDEEGHAPEKDSPVAGIQAASGLNSKGNHTSNHGQLLRPHRPLESAWPCLTALRTAWPSCLPPCTAAPPAHSPAWYPIPAAITNVPTPWPNPPVETPAIDATASGAFAIIPKRIAEPAIALANRARSVPHPCPACA